MSKRHFFPILGTLKWATQIPSKKLSPQSTYSHSCWNSCLPSGQGEQKNGVLKNRQVTVLKWPSTRGPQCVLIFSTHILSVCICFPLLLEYINIWNLSKNLLLVSLPIVGDTAIQSIGCFFQFFFWLKALSDQNFNIHAKHLVYLFLRPKISRL